MAMPISIYLPEHALKKLDAIVDAQAKKDRKLGLEGRQIMNRSKMIAKLISDYDQEESGLDIEMIEYHVVNLAKAYGAKKVSLFGSFARGEEDLDSDVDILLEKGNIKGMQVFDFQEDLQKALDRKVDVVTTAGASDRFLRNIEPDAVVLYEVA